MSSTLILIRAVAPDPVSLQLAVTLEHAFGRKPVFICDERRGIAQAHGYPKIGLTDDLLDGLEMSPRPQNWGWFWGDVCYYAAAQAYPGFDHYCLVESDVYFSASAAAEFANALAGTDADMLARRLRIEAEPQRYSRGLGHLKLNPRWGCIFPVTRVSHRGVAMMRSLRLEAIKAGVADKLNDEAILAGAVERNGLCYQMLEDLLPLGFRGEGFDTNPPHLFEAVAQNPEDRQVYHPVVSFEKVMARIESGEKNYNKHRMRKVLKAAPKEMRVAIRQALIAAEG